MRYITIKSIYEKEITGISCSYQIEFKKKSFEMPSDQKIFNEFFKQNSKFFDRNLLPSFISFKQKELNGSITLFPAGKNLKEIDFLRVCPNYMGIWTAVSQKVMDILTKYKLPELNKIKISIDGFSHCYYLLGFPMVPINEIDYSKSIFINIINDSIISYKDFSEYENRENKFDILPKEIYLKKEYDYDILNLSGIYELCISPLILEDFKKHQCVGFQEIDQNKLIVISP